jgi:hypothetical protein
MKPFIFVNDLDYTGINFSELREEGFDLTSFCVKSEINESKDIEIGLTETGVVC